MNRLKVFLLFVILITSADLSSQGLPPVKNFAPLDYRAENQNWAISQAADKVIYIANNQGLLAYNGGSWILYTSPNETIMRSVKAVGERIYTGCYMEFGFWQKNPFGLLTYTSLSDAIRGQLQPDEEFWNILNVDEFILFQSLKRIYIYNLKDNSFSIINSSSTIPKVFSHNQTVYFQKINEGIFKIENGAEVLVYTDNVVRSDEVIALIPNGENLLFVMRHQGIYEGDNEVLRKWNTPVEDLLSKISIYSAIQLQNGDIALGTISQGLVILDRQWNLLLELNENKSLRNNTVLSLFQDSDTNLWVGLDNGVGFVNINSPYRVYADNRGIVGSVYASANIGNMMYLGTNQGLFYRNIRKSEDFKMIDGTKGQVWSLDLIANTLFCGHHTGTFVIDGVQATRISDVPGTWKIASLNDTDNLLLQGNYSGLYILERQNTGWRLRNKIKGFNHSARFFEVYQDNIFVNHEYKGIFKVSTDAALMQARSVVRDTTMIGANSGMAKYKDKLLYSYKDGIFKYDTESENFVKDSILSSVYDLEEYVSGKLVVDDKSGYLWVFTESNIHYISEGRLASNPVIRNIPLTVNTRNSIAGYE
ncbi:MAG: two-component regulator propeller domain-containing protein, partial [Flavobacteriaceae bacterium]